MPSDPKERRRHAARCAELAVSASTPRFEREVSGTVRELGKLAIELEDASPELTTKLTGFESPSMRLARFWSPTGYRNLHDLRQVRVPRTALVAHVSCLLPRAVVRDLVGPVEQLGVDAVAHEAGGRGKKISQPRVQVTN